MAEGHHAHLEASDTIEHCCSEQMPIGDRNCNQEEPSHRTVSLADLLNPTMSRSSMAEPKQLVEQGIFYSPNFYTHQAPFCELW